MTLLIWLPWPAKELSPNAHMYWRRKHGATQTAKTLAWAETFKAIDGRRLFLPEDIQIKVTFLPPKRRARYDQDNAQASLKSYCDGVAKALQVDDRRFRLSYVHGEAQAVADSGIMFEIGE